MAEGTTGSYATMSLGEDKRIVVHSHIPMPSPGTANAPWFDGRDATLFIERFYQMCKDHGVIDPKNIIERLARYCVTWIGEWMKTLEGYKEGNWEVFSKEIIHEFRDQDITYKIHRRDYLRAITKKPRAWDGNIRAYVREYTTIASTVQANGRLDEFTKVSWFLQGLPEKLRNKVIDKAKLNLSDDMSPIDFRKVVRVTMDLIDQYEGNKKVFEEDEMKQKEMEKLGEQYQLANKPPTVEAPKKTASFAKTEESESKAKAKGSDSANIEAAIEKMTNEFTNLALAMRVQSNQIQGNSDQYYMLQREGPPKPIPNYPTNVTVNPTTVQENTQLPVNPYLARNGSPMTGYSSARGRGGARTGGISTRPSCFYCGKPGHRQSQCYEYQSDMSNGYCHIDDEGNLRMGSKGQNYRAVTPKPGIPNMYIVRSMGEDEWAIPESTSPKKETNQQEETPPANSTSVKVQAGRLAYLMSDGESDSDKEYEPLEERTSVNVGTVGEAKNNQRAKIATPHTQRTGQFITYRDNQASVDDDVMEDVEPINQKKPEIQNKSAEKQRPRYSATDRLSSQIRDSTDANELMGRILNGKVELSVKELIGVSPKLHRAFFGSGWNNSTSKSHARVGVSEPVQPELKINSGRLTSKPMVPKSKTAYGMRSLYAPVTINQQELMALIDTGSEINLLSRKYAEMLKLPMENKPRVTMVVQTGEVAPFYAFCDEVPVQIGDIVTHTPFLIFEGGDQQLILGRPWQFAACWGCNTSEDGGVNCEIYNEERTRRLVFEGFKPNSSNMRYATDKSNSDHLNDSTGI
ncbi:conserved hypothetical protein [Coccidioides posadasii str. Silveira]|uniref:CCHC-type domain-containing protein n=1 Tax=Coccidioides posadasii (strain RMSCC 757 / Silveira) TaxID=443226 RepID=E9DET2_COCPS|nr:conserved hypothetical protein [Coccidioides posadasii str. Silveira]